MAAQLKFGLSATAKGSPRRRVLSRAKSTLSEYADKKAKLLSTIQPLKRGLIATKEDQALVESLAQDLEACNPNPESLACPLINGKWELIYTTSRGILGSDRPWFLRPFGVIYQFIDAPGLAARNKETWPFFNQVSAQLTPMTKSKVAVVFKEFVVLGLIKIKAPETSKGELDTTFVDEDLRISRGDKGNLFVLEMVDPSAKP